MAIACQNLVLYSYGLCGTHAMKNILIVINLHSKWLKVCHMTSSTATAIIQQMQIIFSCFGLPETVVSDNSSQFASKEF